MDRPGVLPHGQLAEPLRLPGQQLVGQANVQRAMARAEAERSVFESVDSARRATIFAQAQIADANTRAQLASADVAGRSVVMVSENAPRWLSVAAGGSALLLGSLYNAAAVADAVVALAPERVDLVASGFAGEPDDRETGLGIALQRPVQDTFRLIQGEAAAEDREDPKRGLITFVQQVIAPGDGGTHGTQAVGLVTRTASEE